MHPGGEITIAVAVPQALNPWWNSVDQARICPRSYLRGARWTYLRAQDSEAVARAAGRAFVTGGRLVKFPTLINVTASTAQSACLQNQLAECVSNRRKLSVDAWRLFTNDAPSEVIVPNCTQVDEAAMVEGMKACCTFRYGPSTSPTAIRRVCKVCCAPPASRTPLWQPVLTPVTATGAPSPSDCCAV